MAIGEKRQLASSRFYLYNRPLHPELFEIHHDHKIVNDSYDVRVWVTGCGHVIGFYSEEASLVEVMADGSVELPQRGLLVDLPLRGEKDHECSLAAGMSYMMNFQVEKMSPAVYAKTHRDLAEHGQQHGLFVPFPQWTANSLAPFSFIDYHAKADELHVFTFHALPADLTVVKTQSIFELV